MNHDNVVRNYAERRINSRTRDVSWKGKNVSCAGRTLFSYHWWPLAYHLGEGLFLKQGDRYSISTSQHQALVQSCCEGPTLSFSALEAAGIDPSEVSVDHLTDWSPDRCIHLKRESEEAPWIRIDDGDEFSAPGQGMLVSIGSSNTQAYWHMLGASLLTVNGKQFLCSLDEQAYFVAQLSVASSTVDVAFSGLEPPEVHAHETGGRQVVRQGEWFFVCSEMTDSELARSHGWTIRHLRSEKSTVGPLPKRDPSSNSHDCRHLSLPNGEILATGCVRHAEHSTLKLGNTWWSVYRNTEIRSWSQGGRFD